MREVAGSPNDNEITLPQAKLLPLSARERLKAAAAIEPDVPFGESMARARAVDSAVFHTRANFPQFFKR